MWSIYSELLGCPFFLLHRHLRIVGSSFLNRLHGGLYYGEAIPKGVIDVDIKAYALQPEWLDSQRAPGVELC